jgi:hypothetical protein
MDGCHGRLHETPLSQNMLWPVLNLQPAYFGHYPEFHAREIPRYDSRKPAGKPGGFVGMLGTSPIDFAMLVGPLGRGSFGLSKLLAEVLNRQQRDNDDGPYQGCSAYLVAGESEVIMGNIPHRDRSHDRAGPGHNDD